MKVRFTTTAIDEIQAVFSYIAANNPAAADAVIDEVDRAISLAATFPKLGVIKYRGIVRMLPLRRYPQYLLFYRADEQEIVVLNLRHSARRRPWDDQP